MSSNPPGQRQIRGSQKLLEGLAKNGEAPSIEEVKKALGFGEIAQVRIPNWLIRGIPPAYLELEGTIEVPIAHLNTVVNRFVALNDSTINLNILINGIPVPDVATLIVRNTA